MNFTLWINKKYDKNLYTYNILDIMYNIIMDKIDCLGIKIINEDDFSNDFLHFMYLHTNNKNVNLIKVILDEEREYFNTLYETDIYDLGIELETYARNNAFDIFNSKNCISNFVELLYKNIDIKIPEEISDNEESDVEDFILYD